jgi:hypothetical protein
MRERIEVALLRGGATLALRALAIGAVIGGIVVAVGTCSGCGGPPPAARQTLGGAAIGVASLDGAAAEGYERAHRVAMEESDTLERYELRMHPWDTLETALRVTSSSLFAADAALDSWGAGGEREWIGLAGCVAVALRELIAAATAVGLDVPSQFERYLELGGQIAAGICPERGE